MTRAASIWLSSRIPLFGRGSTFSVHSLAAAQHRGGNSAPRRRFIHEADELTNAADFLAIELDDDITFFDTGFVRRAFRGDLLDLHAAPCGGTSRRVVVPLDVADRHANLAAASGQRIEAPARTGRTCASTFVPDSERDDRGNHRRRYQSRSLR